MFVESGAEFCSHCGAKIGPHRHVPWWHLHRRIYDWTLGWAYKPSSSVALFSISFTESIVFPVPPDVLLMPLVLSKPRQWARYGFLCSLASVLGAVAAYVIGWLAWAAIEGFVFEWLAWTGLNRANFAQATQLFEEGNFLIVFTVGLTPLPFKVVNIVAGIFGTSGQADNPATFFMWFFVAAVTSRSVRFFAEAALIRVFGPKITPFVDKYFNWLAALFAALLIGGFVIIKYLI